MRLEEALREALGARPLHVAPLSGGCVGDVHKVEMEDGRRLVAKAGDEGGGLAIEGRMLAYLREHSRLPVPEVLFADDRLLIMAFIENSGGLTAEAQRHAAELLADLHDVTAPRFGLEFDGLIGGLHQPNPWTDGWLAFFRDQRLLYMGNEAVRAGRLPRRAMGRLEALCGRLDRWIAEPPAASLLHGDMWGGNLLCHKGRVAGFVDPAVYYGDPEIELAFSTLFGTFGDAFFDRYQELRPLRTGFFEERVALYNLYPLLVHARLFGGSYVASVERTLARYGF